MFSEPQTVTISGAAKTLPRVESGNRKGVFEKSSATDSQNLTISHVNGKGRNRRTVRLDVTKLAADPTLDGVSKTYSESVFLVIDHPSVGYSATETEATAKALVDWLAVAGNLTKVIGGES
jgi:hypothetical protein